VVVHNLSLLLLAAAAAVAGRISTGFVLLDPLHRLQSFSTAVKSKMKVPGVQ